MRTCGVPSSSSATRPSSSLPATTSGRSVVPTVSTPDQGWSRTRSARYSVSSVPSMSTFFRRFFSSSSAWRSTTLSR